MKQAANILTASRILLTVLLTVFALFAFFSAQTTRIVCAAFFFVTALTDFFDGKIARATGNVSNLGKFLDPVADKFMITATYICLAASPIADESLRVPIALCTIVIVLRDLAVTSLRLLSAGRGKVVAAEFPGKIKTFLQCVTALFLFLEPLILPVDSVWYQSHGISYALLALCIFFTLYSGASIALTHYKETRVSRDSK